MNMLLFFIFQEPGGFRDSFVQFDQTEFVTSGGHRRGFDVNQYVQGVLNTYLPGGSGSTGNTGTGSLSTGSTVLGASSLLSNPFLDYWQKILSGSVGSLPSMGSGSLPGLGGGTGSLPGLGGGTGSLPGLTSSSHGMDSVGFAYIPNGCQNQQGACRVHVAFHGCKQGRDTVGAKFARHAGYNEVGEENDVIIIYPQVKADMISNPNGCFDWWGYADANFANKHGVQMMAVKNMIDRVTGP